MDRRPAWRGKDNPGGELAERQGIPSLWYQVDGGDADPATFFYYLSLAAKTVFPGRRRPLPLLTPEYLLDVPTFTRRYFEALFEKAVERAGRSADTRRNGPSGKNGVSFAFVFDTYQDAPADSPIQRHHGDPLGGTATSTTVVFRGTVSDPDAGQTVRLQVEARPGGTAFTGTVSCQSAFVNSATAATCSAGNLTPGTSCHWRLRSVDSMGRAGAWVSYATNAEAAADFRIEP